MCVCVCARASLSVYVFGCLHKFFGMLTHATLKAYLVLAWRALLGWSCLVWAVYGGCCVSYACNTQSRLFRICPWIQLETFQINEFWPQHVGGCARTFVKLLQQQHASLCLARNFLGVSGKPTVLLWEPENTQGGMGSQKARNQDEPPVVSGCGVQALPSYHCKTFSRDKIKKGFMAAIRRLG